MSVWAYPRILMTDIISEVSHVFGISEDIIKGQSRKRENVRPRFACSYLAKQLTSLSYPQIGRALGGRDHSTTLHGRNAAEVYMEHDPEYCAYVDTVRIRLLSARQRTDKRRAEALAVARERLRLAQVETERLEREEAEAARVAARDDMDILSESVATYVAAGGSFVEVRA